MDELIKKVMNVSDANGWYLAENAVRKWTENFKDDDTGEIVPIERSEVIYPMGRILNDISISLLVENGIENILVSNKEITGEQQKYLSLWLLEATSFNFKGKEVSNNYIIPKRTPLECEEFFTKWGELNIKGKFAIKKIVPFEIWTVLAPYESEIEQAEKIETMTMRFYMTKIKSVDDTRNLGELIDKLMDFNMDAEVEVIAHCKAYEFSISHDGGEGCTKTDATCVSFYVDELCTNENCVANTNESILNAEQPKIDEL